MIIEIKFLETEYYDGEYCEHCVPSLVIEGVLQAVLASLGILGNFTSIFILSRRELHSPFNQVPG